MPPRPPKTLAHSETNPPLNDILNAPQINQKINIFKSTSTYVFDNYRSSYFSSNGPEKKQVFKKIYYDYYRNK